MLSSGGVRIPHAGTNTQGLQCPLGAAMPHMECLARACPGCLPAHSCHTCLSGPCQLHICHIHRMQQQNVAFLPQVKCSMHSGPSSKGSFYGEAMQPDPTQKLNARAVCFPLQRERTAGDLLPEGLSLRCCVEGDFKLCGMRKQPAPS